MPTGLAILALLISPVSGAAAKGDAPTPTQNYYVYACAESDDSVSLIRYGPGGGEQVEVIRVGSFPADIEGPHGINVSADGRYWFLSIAHGLPFGSVHKYTTDGNLWQKDVTLGMFPATLDISPTTGLMYVVNFNLHGKMEPSTISVVETATMIEVARIPTGIMPHGARLDATGQKLYSVNMMGDTLMEVDALRFKRLRTLSLGASPSTSTHGPSSSQGASHGDGHHVAPKIKPTWVTPPTSSGRVYVAGNKSSQIFEVDLESWSIARTFKTSKGPYNLAITPDEKTLVVTYKSSDAVGFWDLESGEEAGRVATERPIPHGVVISPDGRYAFVTVEGRGAEPGTVEVYHVQQRIRVAAIEMGKQAGGIAFWKIEP